MTALSDHCAVIREWLGYGEDVYPDSLVTQFVRGFEQIVSETLRCKEMIQIDTGELVDGRVLLPSDWLQMDFVRVLGGEPIHYKTRDDFYTEVDGQYQNAGKYTISGNYLIVGGTITVESPKTLELHYYQTIPPLGEGTNWLMTKYSFLYTIGTLGCSGLHSFDEDRVAVWKNAAEEMVTRINESHLKSKVGGSTLHRTPKIGYG